MSFIQKKILFLLFLFPLFLSAQQTIELGDINRNANSRVKQIAVASSDQNILKLMQKAFSVHGAYDLSQNGTPAFTIRIQPVDSTKVRLEIESGRPAKLLFSEVLSGKDWREASLSAIDLSVTKTSGLPGIFSSRMAFISDRTGNTEVYVSDLLMLGVHQVTKDRTHSVRPSISPDSRTILYTSYFKNGFPDIYKVNLASGQREVFASFKGTNTGATYNSMGTAVAMILSGTGNSELYLSDTKGRNMQRLTRTKGLEADPTWAPDGQRLAFTSDNAGKPQLYEIRRDGTNMKRIPTNISGYCAEPDWNPIKGNLIAFTIAQAGQFEVAVWDYSTGTSRVVSNGTGDAIEPTWAADGRHLIYTERTSTYQRLVLLDTETGHKGYLHEKAWGNASQASCAPRR